MGSILFGLIPALGWGFQGIVMQKVGGNTANKQMGMQVRQARANEPRAPAAFGGSIVVTQKMPMRKR